MGSVVDEACFTARSTDVAEKFGAKVANAEQALRGARGGQLAVLCAETGGPRVWPPCLHRPGLPVHALLLAFYTLIEACKLACRPALGYISGLAHTRRLRPVRKVRHREAASAFNAALAEYRQSLQ